MSSTLDVTINNYKSLIKDLDNMKIKSEKVINRTVSDFKSRAPGWVSQEVTKEYNIQKKEVSGALTGKKSAGSIRVSGTKLDNMQLVYEGRTLTPTHFKMKPATRPAKEKKYQITAQIKKNGGRKPLSSIAFLGSSGGLGIEIPFQRKGDERLPIESIKTVSIPQMITNTDVNGAISKRINEELEKRLQHNVKTLLKK